MDQAITQDVWGLLVQIPMVVAIIWFAYTWTEKTQKHQEALINTIIQNSNRENDLTRAAVKESSEAMRELIQTIAELQIQHNDHHQAMMVAVSKMEGRVSSDPPTRPQRKQP